VQTLPAGVVEAFRISGKMFFRETARLFDVFFGEDFAGEICFDDVLQASDLRVIEKTAARADVGIDEARIGRVLPPVGELVAIGVENRVEAKGLNVVLAKSAAKSKAEPLYCYHLAEKGRSIPSASLGTGLRSYTGSS
jgi:hypothetical protein